MLGSHLASLLLQPRFGKAGTLYSRTYHHLHCTAWTVNPRACVGADIPMKIVLPPQPPISFPPHRSWELSPFYPLKLGFGLFFPSVVLYFLGYSYTFHISSFSRFLQSLALPEKCQIWRLSEEFIEVPSPKSAVKTLIKWTSKTNNSHRLLMDISNRISTSQLPTETLAKEKTHWDILTLFLS